jgi:hypothetical protein
MIFADCIVAQAVTSASRQTSVASLMHAPLTLITACSDRPRIEAALTPA